MKLDDGTIWKNVVTEAKSKVAQTVDDYRGNYKYNLIDEHMRRFNARGAPGRRCGTTTRCATTGTRRAT